MLRPVRALIAVALAFPVALTVAPSAAHALTLELPVGRYVFACDPVTRGLTMNGAPVTTAGQPRRCDTLLNFTLRVGQFQSTESSYVDMRGLTLLPATVYIEVAVFGNARVHGSPANDNLSVDGTVYGYAGDDSLAPGWVSSGKPFTAYGGPGNDILRCHSSTRCELFGSSGNDLIESSNNGASFGGDGDDTLQASPVSATLPATVDGGNGTDLVRAEPNRVGDWQPLTVTPGTAARSVRVTSGQSDVTFLRVESVTAFVGPRSFNVTMSSSLPISLTNGGQPSGSVTVNVPGGVWTRADAPQGVRISAPGLRDVTLDWRTTRLFIVPA